MNQKGWIAPLIILVVLVVGLFVGIQLLKNTQIFKSRASSEVIGFSGPNVQSDSQGAKYLIGNGVTLDLLSPFGPPQDKVLGVSTEKKSFWEEFINTFLVSLKLKKPELQKDDRAIDISVLPVAKKLTPPDTLSPASQADFKTPIPVIKTPRPTPIEVFKNQSPEGGQAASAQAEVEATVGFKIAESPTELDVKSFLVYTSHPMHVNYIFTSNVPGTKTIFVQFQSNKGKLSQVFTRSIELKSLVTPSPSPTPSPTPTISPTPTPSASPVVPSYSPSPTPEPSVSPSASSSPTPAASATPSPTPGT